MFTLLWAYFLVFVCVCVVDSDDDDNNLSYYELLKQITFNSGKEKYLCGTKHLLLIHPYFFKKEKKRRLGSKCTGKKKGGRFAPAVQFLRKGIELLF